MKMSEEKVRQPSYYQLETCYLCCDTRNVHPIFSGREAIETRSAKDEFVLLGERGMC